MIFLCSPNEELRGSPFSPPLAYWPPWPTGLMDPEWPKKRRFLRPKKLCSNGLSEPRSLDRLDFVTQIV